MHRIVILGGPGDGMVAAQIVRDMRKGGIEVELAGFLNDALGRGETIDGLPVLGGTRDWRNAPPDHLFHICLHKVGQMKQRAGLVESFGIPDDRLATLRHPSSLVADGAAVGAGAMIAQNVVCQPGARIGRLASIRAGANLGHDTVLGDLAYVGPNASLCGRAEVAYAGHVGPNAVLTDGCRIAEYAVLSAGAVALRDLDSGSTWLGNPARRVK